VSKTIHMCMDVKGVLSWPPKEFNRMFKGSVKRDDGTIMPPEEFRFYLMEELEKGHKVIPLSDKCEGFDYQTGCPGHEVSLSITEPSGP
jgi:hypothetical protein